MPVLYRGSVVPKGSRVPSQVTKKSSTDYVKNHQPGYINVSNRVTESVTNTGVKTTLKLHIHRDKSPSMRYMNFLYASSHTWQCTQPF